MVDTVAATPAGTHATQHKCPASTVSSRIIWHWVIMFRDGLLFASSSGAGQDSSAASLARASPFPFFRAAVAMLTHAAMLLLARRGCRHQSHREWAGAPHVSDLPSTHGEKGVRRLRCRVHSTRTLIMGAEGRHKGTPEPCTTLGLAIQFSSRENVCWAVRRGAAAGREGGADATGQEAGRARRAPRACHAHL